MSAGLPADAVAIEPLSGAVAPAAAPALPVTRSDAPRVDAFIRAHQLGEWVDAAVRLVPEFFPDAVGVNLHMSWGEPGAYGECVFVEALLPHGANDVGSRRRQFLLRWVRMRPVWVGDVLGFGTRYA